NPLRQSLAEIWHEDSDNPALFINTTEVASGRGRVIAPFSINSAELSGLYQLSAPQDIALSLSTAMILSARFPWLTPAGSWRKIQLVDGGYLDNSGALTALAVVGEMQSALEAANFMHVQINLIVLTSRDFSNPNTTATDYLVPVQALLNARAARGLMAI